MRNLIDTTSLEIQEIEYILESAKKFKHHKPSQLLQDKLIITLFFENSTRTRSSFEVAAKRLGASIVHLDPEKSSSSKGESIEDTFTNLCAMNPDAVIIRHASNTVAIELSDMNLTSVINAGSGNTAHPSQALLDLFTMKEHFGDVRGKKIAIVGDIVNSRVASSGIKLFTRMGMEVILVAPSSFMPQDTLLERYEDLEDVIDKVDVIMSLRAQLERHKKPIFENYEEYASKYCITKERLKDKDILLLHPGPVMRNIDINDEMLKDGRCKVLEQVSNGVFIRMAILKFLLLES